MVQAGQGAADAHRIVSPVGKDPSVASLRHSEVDVKEAVKPLLYAGIILSHIGHEADAGALSPVRPLYPPGKSVLAAGGDHQEPAPVDI